MRFWTHYVSTKPEVDDYDLPLPEHRLFDDEGNVRHAVESRVNAFLQRAKASARKAPSLDLKRRAAILGAIGARWARRGSPAAAAAVAPDAAKTPSRRNSTASAAESAPPARSPRASAKKASPSPSSAKRSRSRSASPRKAPATRSPSPAKAKAKSATPASAKKAKAAAPRSRSRSAKKSTSRGRSSSKARTRSRSASRASPAKKPPTSQPSPKWTVTALKEFAKENAISVASASTKADILAAIQRSS